MEKFKEEEETVYKKDFKLPSKKLKVVPVKRNGSWLPKDHEASFLFKESKRRYSVRLDTSGTPLKILTEEETKYLSNLLDKDLNVHKNKKENFWLKHYVSLDKNIKILDLANPMDYIDYKILLNEKSEIAPSGEEKFNKGTYKFFIDEIDYAEKRLADSTKIKALAYKKFGELSVSMTSMSDFLSAYYLDMPGKRVPLNVSNTWLESEIGKIIENNIDKFMQIIEDNLYEEKVILSKALSKKAIIKEGTKYLLPEGDVIGTNLKDALNYLKDPSNSEELMKIQARIEE